MIIKHNKKCNTVVVTAVIIALLLSAVSIYQSPASAAQKIKKISVKGCKSGCFGMKKGEKLRLKLAINKKVKKKAWKKVKFTSSKKKIASVSRRGVVKARLEGRAVIKIRAKKGKARTRVRIVVSKDTYTYTDVYAHTAAPADIAAVSTGEVSGIPAVTPTDTPFMAPTVTPADEPTREPSASPTDTPTKSPTAAPTKSPTAAPTKSPTAAPTKSPTAAPTKAPTATPSARPTYYPGENPEYERPSVTAKPVLSFPINGGSDSIMNEGTSDNAEITYNSDGTMTITFKSQWAAVNFMLPDNAQNYYSEYRSAVITYKSEGTLSGDNNLGHALFDDKWDPSGADAGAGKHPDWGRKITASSEYTTKVFNVTEECNGGVIRGVQIFNPNQMSSGDYIKITIASIVFYNEEKEEGFVPDEPVPTPVGAVYSGNYRNLFKENGHSDEEISRKLDSAWQQLFYGSEEEKIYYTVGSDMAYIYTADTDDVRSEGMSYGMMICVQMDKKSEFDKLWKWAKTYMQHNSGMHKDYFAWQCNTDGTKIDETPASDGDEYFATALLFASARWGDGTGIYNYSSEADAILNAMLHQADDGQGFNMFDSQYKLPVFCPTWGAASFTDPSYHLPAFYEVWKRIDTDNSSFWAQAAAASRSYFKMATNETTGLAPDYSEFDGTPRDTNGHGDFRFDAWRTAANIACDYAWWGKDDWAVTHADTIQQFFYSKGIESYGNQWTLVGESLSSDHSPGLVAMNAVASLAASNDIAKEFVEELWNIGITTGKYRYYDGCLYMMGLLHVSGNFRAYFPSGVTP